MLIGILSTLAPFHIGSAGLRVAGVSDTCGHHFVQVSVRFAKSGGKLKAPENCQMEPPFRALASERQAVAGILPHAMCSSGFPQQLDTMRPGRRHSRGRFVLMPKADQVLAR